MVKIVNDKKNPTPIHQQKTKPLQKNLKTPQNTHTENSHAICFSLSILQPHHLPSELKAAATFKVPALSAKLLFLYAGMTQFG